MAPNHFTELYSSYSTEKLVAVVTAPHNYQPEAVEAAKNELAKRNVSNDEVERLKTQIANIKPEPNLVAELATDAASYTGKKIHDFVFPKGPSTADSLLNRFTILLFVLAVLKVYADWGLIKFILFYDDIRIDAEGLLYIVEFLALPIIFLLIWKRKRNGWFLLCFYTLYALIMKVATIIAVITWKPSPYADLERIFPQPNLAPQLVWGAFWAGVLYLICRKDVREVFQIKKETMLYSIFIPALIIQFFFGRIVVNPSLPQ